MNNLTVIQNEQELTITSMQIADLVGSRHDNVRRTIDSLVSKSIVKCTAAEDIKGYRNKTTKVYALTERDSYIVVAQISPKFCAKLVDEWMKLKSNTPVAIANSMTAKQLGLLVSVKQEAEDALVGKVEAQEATKALEHFTDEYTSKDKFRTTTALATELGVGRASLFNFLKSRKVITKYLDRWLLVDEDFCLINKLASYVNGNIQWSQDGVVAITKSLKKHSKLLEQF